jgi:adenylate kinase family enzyme
MKNIIVVGPPRIGKTTLSKLVVNQISYFNAINVDVIRESIYKSICINMNKEEKKNYVKNIFPSFLEAMLNQYIKYYNPEMFYIIEGDLLSIEDAIKIKKEYDVDIFSIGTPNISENDLYDRKVVSYKISNRNDNKLVINTLNEAIKKRQDVKGLIIHSDQGFQYTSYQYKKICESNGITISMSRKGTPIDDSPQESFHSILKKETLYNNDITSLDHYIELVINWILFYNTNRIRLS